MKNLLNLLFPVLLCLFVARCSDEASVHSISMIDAAERMLLTDTDSAGLLLAGIPRPEELDNYEFARWCMLCARATNYSHADTIPVRMWQRVRKWIDKHGSPEDRAQVGLFLGRAYAEDGEWDEAMHTYAEALHYAKTHKVYNVAGYICTYMADLYNLKYMSDEVRVKYVEASRLFAKAGNLKSQIYAMKNLAMEFAFIDSFSNAMALMGKVDSIASTLHIQRVDYNIANAYANIYDMQECYGLAEEYYKKAISLDTRHSMKDSMGLAGIYIVSGKIEQAKELVDNMALHNSTSYGVNLLYGEIYKATNDYERALYYIERCLSITDSLTNSQSNAKILEIERKYNHLKIQEENEKLKNARQRFLIYLIICVSFLTIGCIVFYFYRKHAKMQVYWQEEKLKNLDKERSKIAMQLSEAQHLLKVMKENQEENIRLQQRILFLSEKYKELQRLRLENSAIYKKLSSLSTKLQPNNNKTLLTNKLWNGLMMELASTYPNFRPSLYEQCPSLTEEEWHYCCLHVLGFDGNSEAVLLGIIPSSIWVKRSRIKQKLGTNLPKEQTLHDILVDFFLNHVSA